MGDLWMPCTPMNHGRPRRLKPKSPPFSRWVSETAAPQPLSSANALSITSR